MLKINSPLSCKRNWNILFFNRYNYELIQTTQNANFEEKEILYIFAPDGLFAMNETKNGVNKMYYVSTNHLGSINCVCKKPPTSSLLSQRISVIYSSKLTKFVVSKASNLPISYQTQNVLQNNKNSNGNVVDDLSYDVCSVKLGFCEQSETKAIVELIPSSEANREGNRRNPSDWRLADIRTSFITNRGFTGHEHLDKFGLINANARMYEPLTGKFLAPDPYVQAPDYSQSFNRYTYCWNNPVKYTDPSGDFIWAIAAFIVRGGYDLITNNWKGWEGSGKPAVMAGLVGLSGYAGWAIAGSGIPMANTAAIAGASFTNSVGTYIYTGGQTPITMSFGVASYDFTNAKNGFIAGINSLNSLAAKQMLIAHYSQTSSQQYNSPEFDNLFNSLNQLGFPKYSKNYAISNGGTTKQYDEDGAEILDFKIFPWTYAKAWGNKNSDGNNKIYEGSRQGFGNDESKSTNNQIGYENAPGGWNAALYTLNCNPGNWNQKGETNKQYTKATFMVTSSAFGIPVTRSNIYNTHNSYTGILEQESKPGKTLTPFDYVYGMNDNEEHVRISYSTGSYLINEVLKRESDNILRPIVRNEQAVNQEINGKVAYVAKQNVKLGGDGNKFTIRNGSNVNVRAEKSVNLSLGFKVEAGATFSASIANENYGTTLKTNGLFTKSADYSRPSLYLRRVYDYSDKGCPKYAGSILTLSAFPNPTNGKIFISLKGIVNEPINIQLFDYIGKNVYFTILSNDDNYAIDISQLQNGIYLLIASNSSFVKSIKIIKQ